MMAMLYLEDGRTKIMQPANGVYWSIEELQNLVSGYFEVVRTLDGGYMVINEHGKIKEPPMELNIPATRLYKHGRRDVILGPALVIDTLLEMYGE